MNINTYGLMKPSTIYYPAGANSTAKSINDANNMKLQNINKMGGSRRRYKKGGNPNWTWPCYSGGKRRTNRRKSRTRNRTRYNRR
jgi:hypothetical protein